MDHFEVIKDSCKRSLFIIFCIFMLILMGVCILGCFIALILTVVCLIEYTTITIIIIIIGIFTISYIYSYITSKF